ncbi:MAG: glutamine-hydrolyzing GMP synthase [Chitinophagales bacterium]
MNERILIIDFGSQYTQLIARRVRELNVYSDIVPFNKIPEDSPDIKGIILSGSPFSVKDENAPTIDIERLLGKKPILAICFGAQMLAEQLGGKVSRSDSREYGRAKLSNILSKEGLFKDVSEDSQVWMSHGDTIIELPSDFELLAGTASVKVAAFNKIRKNNDEPPVYCLQFHPEVTHTDEGKSILKNFVTDICGCTGDWTPAAFIEETVEDIRNQVKDGKVVLGLSGGVDSSVAAMLLHQAIGKKLYCVFVNNGLLRKNEFDDVLHSYKDLGLNVIGVDSSDEFLDALDGVSDPEKKRKIIGKTFIDVFQAEAKKIEDVEWLGQGTIYPDVIESVSVNGPSVTIKSHHNVGGLPEKLHLKVIEPLRFLFKDEVRNVGRQLGLPEFIIGRHPFPGPGLSIRIIGEIHRDKVRMLQEADHIFIENLKKHNLYNEVWQAGVMLLPVQSVGVMGDERTYENVVALRAVSSVDGMTADWCHLPYEFLALTSNEIINQVRGINRVVYDISSKPPSTIEWE